MHDTRDFAAPSDAPHGPSSGPSPACRSGRDGWRALLVIACLWLPVTPAWSQIDRNPVYTDDSPEAATLLSQASDHRILDNPSEAVRLYGQLLTKFPRRLVSTPGAEDTYVSVRRRVMQELTSDPAILERFRETMEPRARAGLLEGNYAGVLESYPLTPSGLEAGLNVAAEHIKRARFEAAWSALDELAEHPDLSGQSAVQRGWLLGMIGVYGEHPSALDEARDVLAALDASDALSDLEDAARSFMPPSIPAVYTPRDTGLESDLAAMPSEPVWRYQMTYRLASIADSQLLTTQNRDSVAMSRNRGDFLSMIPAVCEDLVITNDGIEIVALDRYDGRRRWRFHLSLDLTEREIYELQARTEEPNGVAISGRNVVAMLRRPNSYDPLAGPTVLLCADRETGEPIWSTTPFEASPDLESAAFVGLPVLGDGMVFTLARKKTQRLLSEYLIGLDLATGEMRWSQHIASSAVPYGQREIPPTVPMLRQGKIYLASPIGCIVAIEAATGETHWLVVTDPVESQLADMNRRPWHFDSVQWTPLGLITVRPNRAGIVVLDPETGRERRYISAFRWGEPRYLLSDDEAVYSVGEDHVSRIPFDAIEEPRQTMIELRADDPMLGRVAVAPNGLIVPSRRSLRLIDLRTGDVMNEVDPSTPGTPMVVGSEVLIATMDGIDSYLPFEVGEPVLRARIDEHPDDPNPALSLVSLAFRHSRDAEVIPAVDAATDAINLDPFLSINADAQEILLEKLLDMAPQTRIAGTPLAEALFVRLTMIANSPEQRVVGTLTYGAYLSRERRLGEAVEAYQSILTTPGLASAYWSVPGRRFRARYEATRRLRQLIDRHGRRIYVQFDQMAEDALQDYLLDEDVKGMLSLAEEYPVSIAAPRACLEAATRQADRGRVEESLSTLRLGLSLEPAEADRASLVGTLLTSLVGVGRIDEALRLARALERDYPKLEIPTEVGLAERPQDWRIRLEGLVDSSNSEPDIGLIADEPFRIVLGNHLLLPAIGPPSRSVILVLDKTEVVAYRTPELSEAWRVEVGESGASVLSIDDEFVLLWNGDVTEDNPWIEMISTLTGRSIWHYASMAEDLGPAIEEPIAERRRNRGDFRRGSRRRVQAARYHIAADAGSVVVGGRNGNIVCIDRQTGNVRWRVSDMLAQIDHIAVDPQALVVAGTHPIDPNEEGLSRSRGQVLLLDIATGRVSTEIELDAEASVQWMDVSDNGQLLYATADAFTCYDLYRQERRWVNSDAMMQQPSWIDLTDGMLLVLNQPEGFWRIDLATGETSPIDAIEEIIPNGEPPQLFEAPGATLLKVNNGVYTLDRAGNVIGRMARSGEGDVRLVSIAPASDRIAVIEAKRTSTVRGEQYMQIYQVDYTGRKLSFPITPNDPSARPRLDRAQALDDWIVVDVGTHLVAFRAPVQAQ